MKVEFNKKQENPFFGMSNTLRLFQNGAKGIPTLLEVAWKEADTQEKKELFWSLLFSFGDIANRQHLGFESKVDNGGFAQREYFRDILPWMWRKVQSEGLDSHRFLELVVDYTTLDNLLAARVRTKKKTTKVEKVINMIDVFGVENLVPVLVKMYRGSAFDKYRVARFLVGYTFNRRENMLPQTKVTMASRKALLTAFCEAVGISINQYKEWKREFMLEANLFSTGAIKQMDRESFIDWLGKLPGNARFRVRNKLFNERWATQAQWYKEWETYKEGKQAEQRVLQTKIDQGLGTDEDVVKLAKVKKEAKVNTVDKSFEEAFNSMLAGSADRLTMQPLLDKVNLNYNTLVIADTSGSMSGKPLNFAAFMATICLLKNPDAEGSEVMGMFSNTCKFVTGNTTGVDRKNMLLRGQTQHLHGAIVDRTKDFKTNYERVRSILHGHERGGTNVASIATTITKWVQEDSQAVDILSNYPIWTVISDGEFNNSSSNIQSLLVAQKEVAKATGFEPFVLIIDVARYTSADIRNFEGADNVMIVPPSPGNIELILNNFKDIDVRDPYVALNGVHRSNRYAPVRYWANHSA